MKKKQKSDEWLAQAIRKASDDLSLAISEAWGAGLSVDMPKEDWWAVERENEKRLCVAHHIKVHRTY